MLFFQVVSWCMLLALRLNLTHRYSNVHIYVLATSRSQLSGKRPEDGKYGLLVSIAMLLILSVSKLVWGILCCHRYQPRVECFPWWTQWFGSLTWPWVGLQVLLGRSSDFLVSLIPPLLFECTAFHSWIWLSTLMRLILIQTGNTRYLLISPVQL